MAFMRWARPKSLSGLMLVGLALIAVPLLIAILTAVLQIRDLADTGTKIVVQGVAGARASQALFGQIASLERTARLYDVLGDPKLLELYRTQDERLSATREQLHSQATSDARSTLEEIGVLQRSLRNTVMSAPPGSSAAVASDLSSRFTQLSALVERVAQQSNAQVDTEVAALEEQTLQARKRLLWQAAPLLPLAVVAVFVLTLGVGRPLRQLDRAISELGQGTFTNTIAVTGPHDLERLGGQLEWLRQRLLELAHERNRFLRHMSHELKTPLANIREGTELLMDVTLLADRGKIRLILENLVSNAVKYSPKGGTIHLRARATGAQLVLDVADNGPGIPPEERGHVFDAFYTGRAAKTTPVKGTGIGLSVVLEFVGAHGGTVQIVDGEFPGAHFRITMPIRVTSGDRPARREPKAHAHAA
ncbi:MAG: sensor histidine kinase [Gammaproteobacteria bacterium]|nr:MAG: sensor histidine kinase [Gammaproteobacteria bacterium]